MLYSLLQAIETGSVLLHGQQGNAGEIPARGRHCEARRKPPKSEDLPVPHPDWGGIAQGSADYRMRMGDVVRFARFHSSPLCDFRFKTERRV